MLLNRNKIFCDTTFACAGALTWPTDSTRSSNYHDRDTTGTTQVRIDRDNWYTNGHKDRVQSKLTAAESPD